MKKFIAALFSLAVATFAANVQILEPTGAEFAPIGPSIIKSLLRAAVSQSGNTPVEEASEIQLQTNVVTMGGYYLIICEQVKGGKIVNSNKQKSVSLEDLDVAIEKAAVNALAEPGSNVDLVDGAPAAPAAPVEAAKSEPLPVNTSKVTIEVEEKPAEEKPLEKRPTRNYKSYGGGVAFWYNYTHKYKDTVKDEDGNKVSATVKEGGDVDIAYAFRFAYVWETSWSGAVFFQSNSNTGFGDYFQIRETAIIGARYYLTDGSVAPFVGGGIGLGAQIDTHYEHFSEIFGCGIAAGLDMGLVMFRASSVQLETGFHYDILWDGFESFSRNFGALTFYIGLNL